MIERFKHSRGKNRAALLLVEPRLLLDLVRNCLLGHHVSCAAGMLAEKAARPRSSTSDGESGKLSSANLAVIANHEA